MEIINSSFVERKSNGSSYIKLQTQGLFSNTGFSNQTAYWLFENSDTVGDAISRIATEIVQIQPSLRDKKTREIVTEHPVLELIKNPGLQITRDRLITELICSYLITGECYPILLGNVKYEPVGIDQVKANQATLIEDSYGRIGEILFTANYNTGSYKRKSIPNRNMWVYQRYDEMSETTQMISISKSNGLNGLSPLSRIYYQALSKYYGNIHNASTLRNASRPGGLFSPGNESLTQQQYEAFKKEVHEHFSGITNSGRTVVAPVPVKYEDFLLKTRDMDFVNLIESSRIDIYAQYGIPLPLVIPGAMSFNNFRAAIELMYDMAVIPKGTFFYSTLGKFLLPRYRDGERFEMIIDEKQLSALKERMYERAKLMTGAQVYSDNEIRNETGYEGLGEAGDQVYKPATQVPSGEIDLYTLDNIVREDNE